MDILGRLLNAFGMGKVKLTDSSGDALVLQTNMHTIETKDGTPLLQMYGVGSHPHPEADVLAIHLGGRRTSAVAIAVGDRRYRLRGTKEGEAWLNDDLGQQVYLTRAGIVISGGGQAASGSAPATPGLPIMISGTPTVTIMADLHVTGAVIAGFGTSDQVSLQTHKHSGVQPGGSLTAAPVPGT